MNKKINPYRYCPRCGNKTSAIRNLINNSIVQRWKQEIVYYRCYECRKDFEIKVYDNHVKERRLGKGNR